MTSYERYDSAFFCKDPSHARPKMSAGVQVVVLHESWEDV
jgi:hypothetical protein